MNQHYLGERTDNTKQRREHYRYIAGVALAAIALAPFILEKSQHVYNSVGGLILDALVVVFVVLYFRESLDKEGNELEIQQNTYNNISDESLGIVDKYLQEKNLTPEHLRNFLSEIKNSSGSKLIATEIAALKQLRAGEKKQLDYSGEFIVFLFILGSLFLVLGSIAMNIGPFAVTVICLAIFGLSFTDTALDTTRLISKFIMFLKKEGKQ